MCEKEKKQQDVPGTEAASLAPARKAVADMGESFGGAGEQLAESNRSAGALAQDGFTGVGQELPDRAFHEKSFGRKFSNVRVYTDAAANKACRDLNARAYTVGNKIAFAEASLLQNRALVAHELTHVGQHTGEGPARKSDGSADDDGIDRSGEDEAERVEAAVGDGKPAMSALGGESPSESGGESTPAQQGPARKAQGPARSSPWGAALTLDGNELKASGSYSFPSPRIKVPIAAVPGLWAFFTPSFVAKVQVGSNFTDGVAIGVAMEGGLEGGFEYGDCDTLGCLYLSANASVSGGFEYKQVAGGHWHFQGDLKFELFGAFGVKVLRGMVVDFRKEFAKLELGRVTAIRVIGTYGKMGPRLDGTPGWSWGPELQAIYDKYAKYIAYAVATFPRLP